MKNIYSIENGWFYISFMKFKESFIGEDIIFENTKNLTTIEQELQEIEASNAEEISDMLIQSYLAAAFGNLWK